MYCEDLDLCLRLWLTGRAVGVAPGARVEHDYDFHKGARKWLLLERNRWWTVLGDYPAALLALLAPALLAAELGLLVVAARDGWLGSKLRSQAAVLRELPQILARRRRSTSHARRSDVPRFAALLSAELDNPNLGPVAQVAPLVAAAALLLGHGVAAARAAQALVERHQVAGVALLASGARAPGRAAPRPRSPRRAGSSHRARSRSASASASSGGTQRSVPISSGKPPIRGRDHGHARAPSPRAAA